MSRACASAPAPPRPTSASSSCAAAWACVTGNLVEHVVGANGAAGARGGAAYGIRLIGGAALEVTDNEVRDVRGGAGGRSDSRIDADFHGPPAGIGGSGAGIAVEGAVATLVDNQIADVAGGAPGRRVAGAAAAPGRADGLRADSEVDVTRLLVTEVSGSPGVGVGVAPDGDVSLAQATIYGVDGSGVLAEGEVTVVDSIIAHCAQSGASVGPEGSAVVRNTALWSNGVDVDVGVVPRDVLALAEEDGASPCLCDPELDDYRLRAGSPCVDAGAAASPCELEPACPVDLGHTGNTGGDLCE